MRTTLFLIVFGILFIDRCFAAEIKSLPAKDNRVLVVVSGEIVQGDSEIFKAAIKSANDAGKLVSNVRLSSVGGNLLEGVKMADAVRFGKISTNVGKNATCASACFLIFAAGATKFANYSAQIGVHGASNKNGEDADEGTVAMAKISKELGVPAAIIGGMVVTPSSDMVWLTVQDLQSMGTSMVGKPNQLPPPPVADSSPTQTRPGQPTQLNGSDSASIRSSKEDWNQLVENAILLSARQNNGRAKTARNCQPELKVCNTGVVFKSEKGTDVLIVRREDIRGNTTAREICTFNDFNDTRWCMDFNTKAKWREMQNSKGDWIKVSDD